MAEVGVRSAGGDPSSFVTRVPAGRYGEPAEIAAAAVWLLLDAPPFLTGAEVPTIRSCVAALLVLLALSLGREAITLRLVAAGAMIVLLLWPEALAGASFQLSFAAVTAIVALHESPLMQRWFGKREEGRAAALLRGIGEQFGAPQPLFLGREGDVDDRRIELPLRQQARGLGPDAAQNAPGNGANPCPDPRKDRSDHGSGRRRSLERCDRGGSRLRGGIAYRPGLRRHLGRKRDQPLRGPGRHGPCLPRRGGGRLAGRVGRAH